MQNSDPSKVDTPYSFIPTTITYEVGAKVTIETDNGHIYGRNVSNVKRFVPSECFVDNYAGRTVGSSSDKDAEKTKGTQRPEQQQETLRVPELQQEALSEMELMEE